VLGALLCAACGSDETESPATARAAIVYGGDSGPDEDAVVLVRAYVRDMTPAPIWLMCSGTMVAPTLLLTARHCISRFDPNGLFDGCDNNGDLVNPVGQGGVMGAPVQPSDIVVKVGVSPPAPTDQGVAARGVKIWSPYTTSICRNDIALVQIDQDLGFRTPIRLRTGVGLTESMRVVGYGKDENGNSGVRHTRSGVPVKGVGQSKYWTETPGAPPNTFAVRQGPCQGDSGGPAFTDRNAVAGVYSVSGGACTSDSVSNDYTQIAASTFEEDLVLPAFRESGEQILLEGETVPGQGVGGSDTGTGGEGGASGQAGDTSGNATGGSIELRGPRKKGGCKCEAVGGSGNAWQLVGLVPLVVLGRRRWRPRGATNRCVAGQSR
jgi:hypothetical protein